MGTRADLVVVGGPAGLGDELRARLVELEGLWTRFRPDSDVSRLNAARGRPTAVHPDTLDVVERAAYAWRRTGGRFDPTVLPALLAAGYDRTFREIRDVGGPGRPAPAPGCVGVAVDRDRGEVWLPPQVQLDLGGIGKGYAADLLVDEALAAGAAGCCVGIGGDVRVAGTGPDGETWVVGVEDPFAPPALVAMLGLDDGAVATSTRVRRAWTRAGERQHHLIDPASGAAAWTGLAAVTVVAGEAWWAEVVAKAAYLAGPAGAGGVLTAAEVTGLLVHDTGEVVTADGLGVFAL